MYGILSKLFDYIFPPSEDAIRVRRVDTPVVNSLYQRRTYESTTYLLPYTSRDVRALIHEAKFHQNPRAISLLGEVLGMYLKEINHEEVVLIPVPLSRARAPSGA